MLSAVRWDDVTHLSRSWVLRLSLALLVVLWESLIWSGDDDPARLLTFARLICLNFSFLTLTAWLVWRSDRVEEQLARWFGSVTAAAALVWLVLFYSRHDISERFQFTYFPNPNTAGAILGLVVVVAASAATSPSANTQWRYLHGATALILFGGVALTGSRASLVAVGLSVTIILLLHRWWTVTVLSLLSGGLLLALSLIMRGGLSILVARGDSYRLELWSYYWTLAEHRLLTGYGIGNEFVYRYEPANIDAPHNMLLSALLFGGLPAAILFVALMVCLITAGIRIFSCTGRLMPLAVSLYMMVVGLFESILPIHHADWRWIYFWLPIGMVAGARIESSRGASGKISVLLSPSRDLPIDPEVPPAKRNHG